jgi:hypothetical protein
MWEIFFGGSYTEAPLEKLLYQYIDLYTIFSLLNVHVCMGEVLCCILFSVEDEYMGIVWIIMCLVYFKNWEDPNFRHRGCNYPTSTTKSANPCLATTCLIECGNWRRMPDQRYNSWGKCHLLGYVFLALWIYNQTGYTHTLVVGGCIQDQSYYYYSSKMKRNHLQFPCM